MIQLPGEVRDESLLGWPGLPGCDLDTGPRQNHLQRTGHRSADQYLDPQLGELPRSQVWKGILQRYPSPRSLTPSCIIHDEELARRIEDRGDTIIPDGDCQSHRALITQALTIPRKQSMGRANHFCRRSPSNRPSAWAFSCLRMEEVQQRPLESARLQSVHSGAGCILATGRPRSDTGQAEPATIEPCRAGRATPSSRR